MDGPVVKLLKRTGGSTVDEILMRVSARPQRVSEYLRNLKEDGLIKVNGPKSITDFDELVTRVRKINGFDSYSADEQRGRILKEIYENDEEFTRTTVRLSMSGYKLALE